MGSDHRHHRHGGCRSGVACCSPFGYEYLGIRAIGSVSCGRRSRERARISRGEWRGPGARYPGRAGVAGGGRGGGFLTAVEFDPRGLFAAKALLLPGGLPSRFMGRNYLQRDIKLLWGLAAARCSRPDCRDSLVEAATAADPEAIIGEIAHIVAHEDDGPRGEPSYPKEEREVGNELTMGLGKVREVGDYVEQMDPILPDFAERLKAGFIAEYRTQRASGVEGDALFEALRRFAAGRRPDFRYQAAGLAVLVYLFEKCEVFEQ